MSDGVSDENSVTPEETAAEAEAEAEAEGGTKGGTKGAERSILTAAGKAFNIFATLLLLVSLGMLIYVTVSAARGKIVRVFGKSVLTVVTGSMEPTLHVGDYIFIESVDPGTLKKDDIITFYSPQQDIFGLLVTHRIAQVNSDGSFVTRGDANPVDDSVSVTPDRIVGKYTGKARLFRWAGSFGDRRKLILAIVMVITSAAAFYEVLTIMRLKRSIDREKEGKDQERERLIREAIDREKERLEKEGYKPEGEPKSEENPEDEVKSEENPEESEEKADEKR